MAHVAEEEDGEDGEGVRKGEKGKGEQKRKGSRGEMESCRRKQAARRYIE